MQITASSDLHVKVTASTSLEKYPAKQHAARVAAALGVEKGLIYLPGEMITQYADSDQPRPFRQLRYFQYLSGVEEPDCHLTYDIGKHELTLWLPPIDPQVVVWLGRGSTTSEAMDKYDIDHARYIIEAILDEEEGLVKHESLDTYLEEWMRVNDPTPIHLLHPLKSTPLNTILLNSPRSWKYGLHNRKSTRLDSILLDSPRANSTSLKPAIDACRVIKDPHEIFLIRRAAEVSTLAHESVLRNLLSFTSEADVASHFRAVSTAHGAKHQSYGIIAGSGSNAAILHYDANDAPFGDSELMCLDAGAEWNGYASDITRTFPLSGSWPSLESKQIYDLVQKMQDACIRNLKPGKQFVENQYLAHKIAIEGLLELGILHNGSVEEIYEAGTSRAFFPHGLGHHLGLEVHDVSPPANGAAHHVTPSMAATVEMQAAEKYGEASAQYSWTSVYKCPYQYAFRHYVCRSPCLASSPALQEGMIITVEPGIYFNEYALEKLFNRGYHPKYINKKVVERYMRVGGVRIEDDILITKNGYEIISKTAKGEDALKIIRGEA